MLYLSQVYSILVHQFYALLSAHHDTVTVTKQHYYNIIDSIPCAILSICMIYLFL